MDGTPPIGAALDGPAVMSPLTDPDTMARRTSPWAELCSTGIDPQRRRFPRARVLVEVKCGSCKKRGSAKVIARVYVTTQGPYLVPDVAVDHHGERTAKARARRQQSESDQLLREIFGRQLVDRRADPWVERVYDDTDGVPGASLLTQDILAWMLEDSAGTVFGLRCRRCGEQAVPVADIARTVGAAVSAHAHARPQLIIATARSGAGSRATGSTT